MLGIFGWSVVAVAGIAAFIEDDANHKALGKTGYDLLRIGAWALVIFGGLLALYALFHPRPPRDATAPRDGAIHITWPPTRLDIFSVLAFAVVAYAAVEQEWIMVGIALFAVLIAVVLPRMKGLFEIGGPVRFKGELIDTQVRLKGVVELSPQSQAAEPTQVRSQALPAQTQPPGG